MSDIVKLLFETGYDEYQEIILTKSMITTDEYNLLTSIIKADEKNIDYSCVAAHFLYKYGDMARTIECNLYKDLEEMEKGLDYSPYVFPYCYDLPTDVNLINNGLKLYLTELEVY